MHLRREKWRYVIDNEKSIRYPYTAPEAQMRKLADYAFMIRDYKFAHTIYDTVRRDYATDKAYKYHAGTQVTSRYNH